MNYLTVAELQQNFEPILDRVQSGEIFHITHNGKQVVLISYDTYELIRIHKDHEEGC